MQYLSKRRGVISVFLLIIFMVTYVFMGLLVDAGRYKMAEAYTEAALDTASNSILASYNNLLFDLYGLFSVDIGATNEEDMEKKIEELYNRYLDETLGLAKTNVSQYRTVLSDAFSQIFLNNNVGDALDTSRLYDFQITELDVGSTVTLADSANVESQIIEYMKFRAPVQLVDDMDGFLKKIQAILSIEKRVKESLTKVEIMGKYDYLQGEAQELLKDIRTQVAILYFYTLSPDAKIENFLSAVWPDDVYANNPFRLKKLAEDFDAKLRLADEEYEKSIGEEKDNQIEDLSTPVGNLRNYIIEEKGKGNNWELKFPTFYDASNSEEKTQYFTEISSKALEENKIHIAEQLNAAIDKKKKEEGYQGCEEYEKYQEEYQKCLEKSQEKAIQQKRIDDYNKARDELKNRLDTIEGSAKIIYGEMDDLYNRVIDIAGSYQDYIDELQAELDKAPNDEDKKTVYMPDIELAQANRGEVLKNIDILKNSRQYLIEVGYGSEEDSEKLEKLSAWMPPLADLVMQNRLELSSDKSEDYTLVGQIDSYDDNYKDANGSKDLYQNPYKQATAALLPAMQGDICSLYSLTSYFRKMYYRMDVDVSMDDILENVKENKKNLSTDKNKTEKEVKESDTIKLDNEAMRKATDYPDYLKVNYLHSEAVSDDEIDFSLSETENVDVGTMKNVLENGLSLIKVLGDLLEGARDNLYVDTYVMSMFPNYYDYKKLEDGKESQISTNAFMKEYRKYTASFAEVEYIITGAGATGGKVFSEKIKAPENGEMVEGFGKLSVSAMRGKLFGTRLLLNCIAMFTDSAKYSQASVLSGWAGPFAPLVTIVLMVAWAVAETILDVAILMGDADVQEFAPDGEVAVFKQGDQWFFSLEGASRMLVEMAVNELTEKILGQVGKVTDSLEKEMNIMISKAYASANSTVNGILDEIKDEGSKISDWSGELIDNIGKIGEDTQADSAELQAAKQMAQEMNEKLSEEFSNSIDGVKDKFNSVTDSVKENAVIAVSRVKDSLMEKADTMIDQASNQAKEFINNHVEKLIPSGRVKNTGSNGVKMGYKDYLYFYLFTMNQDLKMKRIQSVIQANMRVGGQTGFLMETAPASVWADLEVSMKYMFLSNALVPESLRKNGRLRLKVISSQSY